MAFSGNQPERQRWRWPQFSILELLVVTAIFAVLWGFLAIRVERDELPGNIGASFVLLLGLLCWKTVRLNEHFFQFRRPRTADNTGQPQSRPSTLRDAWFVVLPILVLAFYTHWFIYFAIRGTGHFSPLLPEGDPGHVSWAEAWWMGAEILAVGILWLSTGAWVCVMVERHPSIRYKLAWAVSAIVLSPIACPFVYFTNCAQEHSQHRTAAESAFGGPSWRLTAWPVRWRRAERNEYRRTPTRRAEAQEPMVLLLPGSALSAFAALCAIVFWAGFFAPLSLDYNVKATYSQMPTDDHQLEKWLKLQQGVVSNTVTISREGHTVRVGFITEGSAFGLRTIPRLAESL